MSSSSSLFPAIFYVGAVITVVAVALVFLSLAQFSKKKKVRGYLMPTAGLVKIYSPHGGAIEKVTVGDGQTVAKNAPLVTVTNRQSLINGDDVSTAVLKHLDERIAGLTQQITAQEHIGANRKMQLEHRIAGLRQQLVQLLQQKTTQQDKVETLDAQMPRYRRLQTQGYLADVEYEKHYNEDLNAHTQLESLDNRIAALRTQLTETVDALAVAPQEQASKLSQLHSRKSSLAQERVTTQGQHQRVLRAPIAGRVTAVQVHNGQQIESTRPVMALLPQGAQFVANLFIPSRAIGFVHSGQSVELQYDAFPHERFGVYDSVVTRVANAILSPAQVSAPIRVKQPVYRVQVALARQSVDTYGHSTPLASGMTLNANIILEKQSLLDWILDPLYSFKGHL